MSDTDKAMRIKPEWLDPKFHYAWVPRNDTVIAGYQADGYEMVRATDPDAKEFKEHEDIRLQPDGKIGVGDAVLMRRDRKAKEEEDADRHKRNQRAFSSVRADFHATTASLGVPSFDADTP